MNEPHPPRRVVYWDPLADPSDSSVSAGGGFVHAYYPDVHIDPMDGIIAAAVAAFNEQTRPTTTKGPAMSDAQSSYILTSDVPAFLAEHGQTEN